MFKFQQSTQLKIKQNGQIHKLNNRPKFKIDIHNNNCSRVNEIILEPLTTSTITTTSLNNIVDMLDNIENIVDDIIMSQNKTLSSNREEPYTEIYKENGKSIYVGNSNNDMLNEENKNNLVAIFSLYPLNNNIKLNENILHINKYILDGCSECEMMETIIELLPIIDEQFKVGNIYIHCYAGKSRSITLLIVYLMIKMKIYYMEIYNYINDRRNIDISLTFMILLEKIDKHINKKEKLNVKNINQSQIEMFDDIISNIYN